MSLPNSAERTRRASSETITAPSTPHASEPPASESPDKRTLYVVLDFGTTNSAVAFIATYEDSTIPEPSSVKIVRNWKCLGSTRRAAEAPSVVKIQHAGTAEEKLLWGFGVDAALRMQAIRRGGRHRR